MSQRSNTRSIPLAPAPTESWYALSAADDVSGALTTVRALQRSLVLFRTRDGVVVAMDDCCVHRPYPLSLGRLIDDTVQCGLCGFVYDATGQCVHVPTQTRIPSGAVVRTYPTREQHGQVWVWFGTAGLSDLHRVPDLPWLVDAHWAGVEGSVRVAANYLLLHESFADVTKIPVLAPEIAPAALEATPPLDVVVAERTVTLTRSFPPSPLLDWQIDALGIDTGGKYTHDQRGRFLAPGCWVDHWDADGDSPERENYRLRFTHLLTPIDERTTDVRWTISRDFALQDSGATARLTDLFTAYYARLATALARMQDLYAADPARTEVSVNADGAALRVRDIVRALLAEEGRATRPVRRR